MCIVIDINTFHSVFNSSSENHAHFKPVTDWIISGKGKVVCGGEKYFSELEKLSKYLKFFNQLKRAGKVVIVDELKVNEKEDELKRLCDDADFDDPHIVALMVVSGCRLICSEDARSYPYLKRKEWFPRNAVMPKIYCIQSSGRAGQILTDRNIADICLPCIKLNKDQVKPLAV